MRYYIVVLCVTILTGCSFEKRLERKMDRANRKIEKLVLKYPDLIKTDTVVDTFKVVVPEVQHDTSFVDVPGDTIEVIKDRLKVKYVRQDSTVYISGECETDTIFQRVEVPVQNIEVKEQHWIDVLFKRAKQSTAFLIIGGLIVLILLLFITGLIRQFLPFKN